MSIDTAEFSRRVGIKKNEPVYTVGFAHPAPSVKSTVLLFVRREDEFVDITRAVSEFMRMGAHLSPSGLEVEGLTTVQIVDMLGGALFGSQYSVPGKKYLAHKALSARRA